MSDELRQQEFGTPAHEVVAGRYELMRPLARGGMGEVFLAQDRSLDKTIALKRLLPNMLGQRSIVLQFMREYHALSELRHPRIIEVYDYGVDRDVPYYTMELLDGQDLRELSPMPYREACLYLRDVASSLALLHARRLLHRDLSPRNVRRTSDGHCKLLDFGAMIPFGVPPNITGTAPYIAPEAVHGGSLDQRADLYSLGALAYSMLTGRQGYAASRLDELPKAWSTPLKHPNRISEIPEQLDALIVALMSLDAIRRPSSAAEVIERLSAIAQLPPDDAPDVARSFFTSTQLYGRGRETRRLIQHIERTVEGHGAAIVIEGEQGRGKTRMLAECALIAQTHGLAAVHAVARSQRGSSHALAQELVAAVQQVLPLEAAAAGLGQITWPKISQAQLFDAEHSSTQDRGEARAALLQTLTDAMCATARARPMLMTVDDMDRADDFSAALIASVAHRAANFPLLIVVSRTPGRNREARPELDALGDFATTIPIGELSRAETASFVSSIFGCSNDAAPMYVSAQRSAVW